MDAQALFPNQSKPAVCVFCASSPGKDPIYMQAAKSVGVALAEAGVPMIYGGGIRGLMGATASAALTSPSSTGRVHGILPKALSGRASESTLSNVDPGADDRNRSMAKAIATESKEGTGEKTMDAGEDGFDGRFTTEMVDTMHERKLRMAQLSEGGFLVLPGGFGTYEELFEMTTWNQLKIHQRPVVLLNVKGFYTPLRTLITNAVDAGFIAPINQSLLKIVDLDEGEDEETADWGKKGLDALNGWVWEAGAGYNLNWKTS